MQGSVRSWIHYIDLRTSPETQKEHRDIATLCAACIDVVFPISDDPNFTVARADNRTGSESSVGVGTGTASAIALMPDATTANVMDEFLFEFENDINPADPTKNDQGLKIIKSGFDTNQNREILSEINKLNNPYVCEIGAGWGGFTHCLANKIDNAKFIIVDLPQTLIFSYLYLCDLYPDKKIKLYK